MRKENRDQIIICTVVNTKIVIKLNNIKLQSLLFHYKDEIVRLIKIFYHGL